MAVAAAVKQGVAFFEYKCGAAFGYKQAIFHNE
jgi:hypothetical protein